MTAAEDEAGRVLILAPIGRDASTSAALVRQAGVGAEVCDDLDGVMDRLDDDVVAVLLTEESLYGESLDALGAWVRAQPAWSDQPFIVLTNSHEGLGYLAFRRRLLELLGNVSFLERPLRAITLQTATRAAARARRRQYQARAHLEAQRDAALALERLVAERTADLERANDQLREEMRRGEQAQAALLQAQKIETMGQLVGGVAHDFNNLLMAVIGNLDLLGKAIGPEPRLRRLLGGAVEGARRGATLTQRLLAFARKQELQARATDLVALVRDMRGLIDGSLGPLVRLEIEPSEDLPAVVVDRNQLEMALLNLAVNARDAMPQGGRLRIAIAAVDLSADSQPALPAGRYLHLSVRDSGVGMDQATLAKAVEPFFSTKGLGKGTGLGLSMVHGLATQSGGAFRLRSAPGEGTTAELWLPAAAGAAEQVGEPGPPPANAGPATILLVDDDALIAASTLALLEDLGHHVVEANSAPEALELLEGGFRPDLIITDHAMPGMTGTEMAVKVHSRTPDMPILLATGYAELDGPLPMDLPRLAKPYTQDELAAEIGRLLPKTREAG
jgi:signal transduction histidine kinase